MARWLALVALVAIGLGAADRQSFAQKALPPLRIRPILTSNDPAGDDATTCYVEPQTHPNGATDSPLASPATCVLEVSDTLTIQAGSRQGPAPTVAIEHLVSPSGAVSMPPRQALEEVYFGPGSEIGRYTFHGTIGSRPLHGGFTVRLAAERVLQIRYVGNTFSRVDGIVLAGYAPGSQVNVDLYDQIAFDPNVGTGERRWRYASTLTTVTVDARGEARLRLPFDAAAAKKTFLLVSDPQQQNDLFSGAYVPGSP